MARRLLALAGVLVGSAAQIVYNGTVPWGIHIAYGPSPSTSMSVVWSTRQQTQSSCVQFGPGSPSNTAGASQTGFSDVGNTQYIHKAELTGLAPSTAYTYRVGDCVGSWSAPYTFRTAPASPSAWAPRVAIYGDMGIDVNAHKTLPLLYGAVANGTIDAILHIGDLAYDLDSNNGSNGDQFVANMQPIAAQLPYHTCPGNHESDSDFLQYRSRYPNMPLSPGGNSTGDSSFHSVDIGLVHYLLFSSEAYFYLSPHGLLMLPEQYAWLEANLASVDRTKTPWIVLAAHRPMYCSPNDDSDDCHSLVSLVRDGILGAYGMESLMAKYGVELFFGAHEHSYERNYPVYQYAWNASNTGPGAYVEFDRPIHILTGAAGCPENQDAWQAEGNPFSALRLNVYGYGVLTAESATTLLWQFLDDTTGAVVDSITIVRSHHGPFNVTALEAEAADRRDLAAGVARSVAPHASTARPLAAELLALGDVATPEGYAALVQALGQANAAAAEDGESAADVLLQEARSKLRGKVAGKRRGKGKGKATRRHAAPAHTPAPWTPPAAELAPRIVAGIAEAGLRMRAAEAPVAAQV